MRRFLGQNRRRALVIAIAAILVAVAVVGAVLATRGGGHPARNANAPAGQLRTVLTRTGNAPGRPGAPGQVGVGSGKAAPQYVPGRLIVRFDPGTSAATVNDVLDAAGAQAESKVGRLGIRVVTVPPGETGDALDAVADAPSVDYVERDVAVRSFDTAPNDSLWSGQWGPRAVGAPKAWDTSRGSPDVVIAVLDTGTDASHADLQGRVLPGYDFVNGDNDASDDHGHGTAAAGVIAAATNNARGQAGMCWNCQLLPVKVLGADGSGSDSTVAQGIIWATDHGARVISMSLGGTGTTETLGTAITYAVNKGVILVAAAGNAGNTTPNYPAAYPSVLSVAGTTESDSLYSWSNRGAWVQVAAPGCDTAPWNDGGYVNFCGTSAATPVVAGLVGLALSAKPSASSGEVLTTIRQNVAPIGDVQYGRVSAVRTLAALVPTPAPAPATPAPSPAPSTPTTQPSPSTSPAPSPPAAAPQPAPSPAPAVPNTSTRTFRGIVTRTAPLRTYPTVLRAGTVSATVTFTGARPLRVTLVDRQGRAVARLSGPSPLRLSRSVSRGSYRLVVTGPRRASTRFVMTVSAVAS